MMLREMTNRQPIRLPMLQWLLLAFLSLGLANDSFHFQSLRPVSQIENVFSVWQSVPKTARTVHYGDSTRINHPSPTIRLQSIRYLFLSHRLETLCKVYFVLYTQKNHLPFRIITPFVARRAVISPEDVPVLS